MKIKEPYEAPCISILVLLEADIITSSGGNDIGEDPGENDGEWM